MTAHSPMFFETTTTPAQTTTVHLVGDNGVVGLVVGVIVVGCVIAFVVLGCGCCCGGGRWVVVLAVVIMEGPLAQVTAMVMGSIRVFVVVFGAVLMEVVW